MSFATWIAFVIAGSLIAISPGSGAVLSMSHGLAYGVRKASGTVFGLQLGLLLVLAIAGTSDRVTLVDPAGDMDPVVTRVRFVEGGSWTASELALRAAATAGDDHIIVPSNAVNSGGGRPRQGKAGHGGAQHKPSDQQSLHGALLGDRS